jgi:hypothetical protein
MPENISTGSGTEGSWYWGDIGTESSWVISGNANYITNAGTVVFIKVEKEGLHSELVFKFLKKKLSILGNTRYKSRLKRLRRLAYTYFKQGQNALSDRFLAELKRETILSEVYGCGLRFYLKKSLIDQYKYKVRGGHISHTLYDKYTNPIPKDIAYKKLKLEKSKIFDDFVIYHYWNEEAEDKKKKREENKNVKVSEEEKSQMRDPILFGIRKDCPDILFFIDEWVDDYCDLSFDELVNKLPVKEKDIKISINPTI